MRLGLLNQKYIAAPYQYFVCLFVRQSQIYEVLNESTQLIEDQVRVGLELYLALFLLRLHQSLQTLEAFLKDVRITRRPET